MARALARSTIAAVALLAVLRVVGLEVDTYDAYETRLEARWLLDGSAGERRPGIRPPALVLVGALAEAAGCGWRGPAALSLVCWAATLGLVVALARRCGAPAWAAEGAAALVALDHLLWLGAASGANEAPAAAASAAALALALGRPRPLAFGLALGVAASLRPTNGLLGLALLAWGGRSPWTPGRLVLAGGAAAATYGALAVADLAWARGGLAPGLAALREVLALQADELPRILRAYSGRASEVWPLAFALRAGPLVVLLAAGGAALGLRRAAPEPRAAARLLLAWALLHALVLCARVHPEGRYVVPALPALGGLAALALARLGALARAGGAARGGPAVVTAAALAATAAWVVPFEWSRCRDPLVRASFPARLAFESRRALAPDGRLVYTTAVPFPVVPAVARAGDRYPGDPFFGLLHLGPAVLEYELRRGAHMVHVPGPDGRPTAGLTDPGELRRLVRLGRLPDGTPFRPGDVLLVGVDWLPVTWEVARRPRPPFGVHRVVRGGDGRLDLALAWLRQEDGGLPRAALAAPGIVAPGAGPR